MPGGEIPSRSSNTDPMTAKAYASLLRRFQSLVFDTFLYFLVVVAAVLVPAFLELGDSGDRIFLGIVFAFALLYEPLLVGLRGATLGHRRCRIRVVDARTERTIGPLRAFGRFILKGMLGFPSFFFMLITRRAQSLHDLAFSTVVLPANPEQVARGDLMVPVEIDSTRVPSAVRRIAVILLWSFLTLIPVSFLLGLAVSDLCLENDKACSAGESFWTMIIVIGWFLAIGVCLVQGWRGRLWGARLKPAGDVTEPAPKTESA